MGKSGFLSRLLTAALISTVVYGLGISAMAGQTQAGRQTLFPAAPDNNTPREVIYPYYSLREGDESTLVLMDRAPRPIEFIVAVHAASGRTVSSEPMTIQPEKRLEIDIKKLLTDLSVDYRGEFVEGSVSLHFKGQGSPLGGRMLIESREGAWNLGPVWREGVGGESMIPEQLESLWWDLGGPRDAVLTVNNISGQIVTASMFLDFNGKRHESPPFQFKPYEMKRISVTEVLADMGLTPYKAPLGGISIVAHGIGPVLVAHGKLTDAETKRTVGMIFPLPQLELTNALHMTGVPISIPRLDSPFAGTGNYIPHFYVRNLLDSTQVVTLTIEYPGESGPQSRDLPPISLPGYSTQDIRLDAYFIDLPLPLPFCSVRIQYSGPPGSVIVHAVTENIDADAVETIGVVNEGNGYAGSLASYWDIDDDTDFYVFLTNMGNKECRVGFRIEAAGTEYHLTRLKLAPHETQIISLREIRDKQQPDFRGNVIPANATGGRLFYSRLDNVPMMGRVVAVPRKK